MDGREPRGAFAKGGLIGGRSSRTGDKRPRIRRKCSLTRGMRKKMVPRKGLGLDPSNYSKNSRLPLRQVRLLYHWTVRVSTLLWAPIGTHGKQARPRLEPPL